MEIFQPVMLIMLVFRAVNFAVEHPGRIFLPEQRCCAGDLESTRVAYLAQWPTGFGTSKKKSGKEDVVAYWGEYYTDLKILSEVREELGGETSNILFLSPVFGEDSNFD